MSLLQQQLNSLQLEKITTLASGMRKQAPSLIFGANAKQVPMQTVYEISLAALHELQTHSELFQQFESSIFAASAINFDRDVSDVDTVKKIDQEIKKFLKVLVGHFQYNCAINALEFLIRRFRIDLHFSEELFYYLLPYHDLETFGLLTKQVKINCLEGVEQSFPMPRNQMYSFFIKNNYFQLQKLFEVAANLTHSGKLVYSKFLYTLCMEMLSQKSGNIQELIRKCLEFALSDIKKKIQTEIKYYCMSLVVICCVNHRDVVSTVFIDKFVMQVLESKIEFQDIVKLLAKIFQATGYQISEYNALHVISQFKEETQIQDKIELVSERIFMSLLKQQSNAKLQENIDEIYNYINKSKVQQSLITLTRLLLQLYNNNKQVNVQQMLTHIEKNNTQCFNEGLTEYIKNGGDVQAVSKVVHNQLSLFLNTQADSRYTFISALQNQQSNVRYEAYLQLQTMQLDENLKKMLVQFVFNELQFETDLQVVKIMLQFTISLKQYLEAENRLQVLKLVWRRIVSSQTQQVYTLCALLSQLTNTVEMESIHKQIKIQEMLENFTSVDALEEAITKAQLTIDCQPFDSKEQLLHTLDSHFHYKSYLVVYVIHYISEFIQLLSPKILNEIMQNNLLNDFYLRKFLLITEDSVQKKFIKQLDKNQLKVYLKKYLSKYTLQQFIYLFINEGNQANIEVYGQYLLENLNSTQLTLQQQIQVMALIFFLKEINELPLISQIKDVLINKQSNKLVIQMFELDKDILISTSEFCQMVNQQELHNQQIQLIFKQFFTFLHVCIDEQVVVQSVTDMVTFMLSQDCLIAVKKVLLNQVVSFIEQRQHIDFCLGQMVMDYLFQINDEIFVGENTIEVDKLAFNMLICLEISHVQPIENSEEIPYIIWVLVDFFSFAESKEIQILQQLPKAANFNKLRTLAQKHVQGSIIKVSKCQSIIQSNPIVFVQQLLNVQQIEEKQELCKQLIQLMLTREDEILHLNVMQLIVKLLENNEIVLSANEARDISEFILNNQITHQMIDRLIQFIKFLDFEYLRQMLSKMYDNQITVIQSVQTITSIFNQYNQKECIVLISFILDLISTKQLTRLSPLNKQDYTYKILTNVMNFMPEFLSAYIIMNVSNDYQVDPVELLSQFKSEEVLGTASVLLGYLFNIPEVVSFLQEENENYSPIQILDQNMKEDASIIDKVLHVLLVVLQQPITEDIMKKSSSISKEESPLSFLLKVCIQMPENVQYISKQVAQLFSFDDLIQSVVQIENSQVRYLIGDLIQDQNAVELDQALKLNVLLFTELESKATQYLANQLLQKVKGCENIVQEFLEAMLDLDTSKFDEDLLELYSLNLSLCPQHLQQKVIQYFPRLFSLIENNYRFKQLVINLIICSGKYLAPYVVNLLNYLSVHTLVNDSDCFQALQSLAQHLPLRVTVPRLVQFVQGYSLNNPAHFIASMQFVCSSFIAQMFSQGFEQKQLANLVQLLALRADYKYQTVINQFENMFIQQISNLFGKLTAEDFVKYVNQMQQFFLEQTSGVKLYSDIKESLYEPNIHRITTALKLYSSLLVYKQFQNYLEDKMVDLTQSLLNVTVSEQNLFEFKCINPLQLQLAVDSKDYLKAQMNLRVSEFFNQIFIKDMINPQIFEQYCSYVFNKEQPKLTNQILEQYSVKCMRSLGLAVTTNPTTQHLVQEFTRELAEAKRFVELKAACEGIHEAACDVDVISEIKGAVAEGMEVEECADDCKEMIKLIEKMTGKEWKLIM
ncbi:Conserved_hypothetical protein [Hexamita inflata]|uniref:HEAT repeat-containing protein 1 n=1 Tax=Hexamita inflata TaxID=28002 RepID=A0AA86PE51_9EUKA|nr:Conserved hypothetical protein [Hexamita inflata]